MRAHESQGSFTDHNYGEAPFKVLIFDDSPFETQAVRLLCEMCAYVTAVASTEDEAVAFLTNGNFNLLVVDYHQPAPFDCIEFLRRIADLNTAVALTSASDRVASVHRFLDLPHLVAFYLKVSGRSWYA